MKKFITAMVAIATLLIGNTTAFAGAELSVDAFSRHVWRGAAGNEGVVGGDWLRQGYGGDQRSLGPE